MYACLVCGKYFQGRGKGSWAYRHAVGDNHRVWLNLDTEKVSEHSSPLNGSNIDIYAVLCPSRRLPCL